MSKEELRAEKLRQLEAKLNALKFNKVEIGSLLAYYLGFIFRGSLDKRLFRHFAVVVYLHLKALKPKVKFKDLNKTVLYFKTASLDHYTRMGNTIIATDSLKKQTLIVGPPHHSMMPKEAIFGFFNFNDLLKSWVFLMKNSLTIWRWFKEYRISKIDRIILYFMLFCQLTQVQSVMRFFLTQKNAKLVGGDYDRGDATAIWFSVAKTMRLKSYYVG
jgi:hypothetical protein